MATRAGEGRRARPRRVRRLRRPRRRRRHGRDRQPLRHPGRRSRSCSTRPSRRCSRPASSTSAARRILNSANLEDGERRGQAPRPRVLAGRASTAPPSSASPSTKRARPATPSGSCGSPSASTTSPSSATASSPTDLIFDALTFPLVDRRRGPAAATASRPSRRSAASRPSCPASSTVLGLSNVPLRPQARGPPRAQQRVPARVPRGRPRRRHRARGADHAAAQDRRPTQREVAPRPHLRPPPRRLRPAHRAHGAVRGRRGRRGREGGPLRLAGRGAARSTASSTATATASRPTSTRRSTARAPRSRSSTTCCSSGMKVVGELFGRARCSCRSCCSRPRR